MMDKRIIAVLAVAFLALAGYAIVQKSGGAGFLGAGAYLSLQKVEFDESIPELSGGSGWLATVTQIPLGSDYAVLGYTTLSGSGKVSTNQLRLTSDIESYQCQWPITRENDRVVYDPELYTQYGTKNIFGGCNWPSPKSTSDWCVNDHVGDYFVYRDWGIGYSSDCVRACYVMKTVGIVATTRSGQVSISTKFEVSSSDGISSSTTISGQEQVGLLTHDGKTIGKVKLTGYLWDGATCDNKINFKDLEAFYDPVAKTWTPTRLGFYTSYKANYDRFKTDIDSCPASSKSVLVGCLNSRLDDLDGLSDKVQTGDKFYVYNSLTEGKGTLQYKGGDVLFFTDNTKFVAFPVFQLFLSADWIKIGQLSGMPKILGAYSNCFQSGDEAKIAVNVQNIGKGEGIFQVSASCPTPFIVGDAVATKKLQPGDSQIVYVSLSTNAVSKETKKTCTVTVKDASAISNVATASVEACSSPITICGEGDFRCKPGDDGVLQICRVGVYEDYKTCDYKCFNGQCIDKPVDDDGIDGGKPPFDSWMFAAMVAVLFGILTFSAVYSYRKKPKNKFVLSILGAMVVGVIVFVAVEAMNLPIENPFDLIRPNIQACSCPDCWLPFDVWGCELANVVEGIKYLICLGIGVIAGFLLYKTLANLPEFRDKMLMVLTLVGISALIVFIIALALFWFAVVVLVIFAFFKWVMSPLALVGKIGGLVSKVKK